MSFTTFTALLNGQPYDDPNLLAKEVIRAANDVGLRIALLRVAYERAGFQTEPNPLQVRFIEQPKSYLKNLEQLMGCKSDMVRVGAAPHSVRAVSLDYLKQIDRFVKKATSQFICMSLNSQQRFLPV